MNRSVETPQVCTTAAHGAVAAAVNHARSLGITINAAVTDGSGTLMAFLRMNGAFLHSIDIALDKAYTAASFGLPTSKWSGVIGDDELLRIGLHRRERPGRFGGGAAPAVQRRAAHRLGRCAHRRHRRLRRFGRAGRSLRPRRPASPGPGLN